MAGPLTAATALAAHYAPYAWFALTWTIVLVVVCAAGALLVTSDRAARAAAPARSVRVNPRRPLWLAAAATLLAAFVSAYSYLIPYHEDLIGLDVSTVTAGRFVSVPIWPATGRFFPFGDQEYNLLGLFGRSAAVYHGFSIVELVVVVICCFRILDDVPGWLRCCAVMVLMVLPSFVVAFFGIVYPERDMIVWLALWIVCLMSFERTSGRLAFCGAVVAAQCLVYYKETAFILIGGFAIARLTADAVRDRGLLRRREYLRFARAHVLELAHLAIASVFVVVYALAIARHVASTYASAGNVPGAMLNALTTYAGSDWLLDTLVVVLIGRLAFAVVRRQPLDALWDSLAIAAVAYALAFVKLGLTREYYLGPPDFVSALYLARLAYSGLLAQPRRVAILAAALVAWAFQYDVRDAAGRLLIRKQWVQGNVQLAAFLEGYSASHGRSTLQLFFPGVGGFELMELSSYLHLKGFADGRPGSDGARSPGFIVKTAHRYPGDRCLASQEFRCVFAASPDSGDLVVYLAGRELPPRVLDTARNTGVELFHYRPVDTGVEHVLRLLARRNVFADRNPDVRVFDRSRVSLARRGID